MRRMYQKYVLLFNMNYTIRKSLIEDLADILCLRDEAREYMRKNGNLHQWPVGYPHKDTFISDIESGNSYIVENSNGIPVGTFAFLPCPEPTYQTIYKGKWLAEDLPYYVIHRIASKSSEHGIMEAVLEFCFSKTDNIRIDTHDDNKTMQHILLKNGFTYCGIIYLKNGDERLAYQKVINNGQQVHL